MSSPLIVSAGALLISARAVCRRALRSTPLWASAMAAALCVAAPRGEAKPAFGNAAVASEHPLVTQAALGVLKQGGNAVDAVIAAALMAGVVSPSSSGLGGGGFALVYSPNLPTPVALDFREVAPQGVDAARLDARPLPPEQRGALVGVPGEARGLELLHKRFGRNSFASLAKPAEQRARQGFAVGNHLARTLSGTNTDLKRDPSLARIFFPGGRGAALGRVVRNPELAKTLTRLAQEGSQALYYGPIAAEIASTVQAHGGSLSEADLANYAVVERTPLKITWGADEVFTMPTPSAGGMLLAQTLGLFSKDELARHATPAAAAKVAATKVAPAPGATTSTTPKVAPSAAATVEDGRYQHLLAEAFRAATIDRFTHVGDPAFVPDPTARLLAPSHLAELRKRIAVDRTHSIPLLASEEHGTHHMAVADAQGMVVSLTTTVNRTFGAKLVTPESGLVLNDQLDDFTQSRDLTRLGLRSAPNAPRAGARPVSSMTPTIVVRGGRPVLAIGGSGGMTIPTNVTQLLIAQLALGKSATELVQRPRIYVPVAGRDTLLVDAGFPQSVLDDLAYRGERVSTMPFTGSAVQLLSWDPRGWSAAADPRKFGAAGLQ